MLPIIKVLRGVWLPKMWIACVIYTADYLLGRRQPYRTTWRNDHVIIYDSDVAQVILFPLIDITLNSRSHIRS